jgi:hypothetical protein
VGRKKRPKPFDKSQGKPFVYTQDKPFDKSQGKPFVYTQGKLWSGATHLKVMGKVEDRSCKLLLD